MDTTKRIYHITKQLYPTTNKPYFVVAQIFSEDRMWYSTYHPGHETLEIALVDMCKRQSETAQGNEQNEP